MTASPPPAGSPAPGASTARPSAAPQEASATARSASSAGGSSTDREGSAEGTGTSDPSSETNKPASPPLEAVEPPDRPRDVALVVQTADVQPLDVRAAETEAVKLLGSGAVAIMTASPTPTLAVYPLASGRDVLVLHAGLATERFPATSRTLLQLRPSVTSRGEVLSAHAWQRGIRRLAVLSGGDPFGRALRAAVSARWRQAGGHLVHDESVSLDTSDLRSRLRTAARTGPDAILLGYQGAALGDVARALRGAGYTGQILAADDDRAALLAGGPALDGALILSDAFVPVPGSRGARFAKAYEARAGNPPSRFAANAYEAATLLATAAARVSRGGRGITGSRLRDALVAGRTFPSLYAGDLVVRDDGTIGRPLALFKVDGGKLAFESYVGLDGAALAVPKESTP
jgi:ABC-type branched-subunit amino acid transport system substrate-binding protein